MIYFIEAHFGDTKAYKIGFTRKSAENRLKQLQVTSPVPLRLVKVFEGGLTDEKRVHGYLNCLRIHNEWFSDGPLIRDFLKKPDGAPLFRSF